MVEKGNYHKAMSDEIEFGCYFTYIDSLALCGGTHVARLDGLVVAHVQLHLRPQLN